MTPFTTGLSQKDNLYIGTAGFIDLDGFYFSENGAIKKWSGFSREVNRQIMLPLPEGGAVTGLFTYKRINGTREFIAMGRTGVYKQGVNGNWDTLLTGQTGTATDLYGAFVLNNQFYFGNGVDANRRYNSGNPVSFMGMTSPALPTVALDGAGFLTGGYSWRYSYVNDLNEESNMSPASLTLNPVNQSVNVTLVGSTDPQVTKWRLYRTTIGGGVYLRVAEITHVVAGTVYTDNNSDSVLGIEGILLQAGVPPPSKIFVVDAGRVYMVGKNSSTVHFSSRGFPAYVHPNDNRILDPFDEDIITGGVLLSGIPVFFKNDSIWNGFGGERGDIGFTRREGGIGSSSHYGIVLIPGQGIAMFPHETGFYSYDTVNLRLSSEQIEPIFTTKINRGLLSGVTGGWYSGMGQCAIWAFPSVSSGQNDLLIVYNYTSKQWSTRKIPNTKTNLLRVIEQDNFEVDVLYCGGYNGVVYHGDVGQADDGFDIACSLTDRMWPKGASSLTYKIVHTLTLFYDPSILPTDIPVVLLSISELPDGPFTPIGTISLGNGSGVSAITFNYYGHRFYWKLSESSNNMAFTLRGVDFGIRETGREALAA